MTQGNQTVANLEYRVLKLETHQATEKTLNGWAAQRWELVSDQAAGDAIAILHFPVFKRAR